jgi:hypothetical protein
MNNACVFSPCRTFRYRLDHVIREVRVEPRRIMWIGLNPSTADERQLDPTLRRIRGFSEDWGYDTFVMTNAFAFRATLPGDMRSAPDPVGPDNDAELLRAAGDCGRIVACWGVHGEHLGRGAQVTALLRARGFGRKLVCLGRTGAGHPKHPLYLRATTVPERFS